jgi:RNA polymerase sigma-70 factor (sigma-E family)
VRVAKVKQDQREFTEFYEAACDECLRIVWLSCGSRQLAEDLVAEAFTRAWLCWPKVRGLDQPRAWVVRVALNTHVSWWRRRRREVALDGHDTAATTSPYPALDTAVLAALRRLPPRQREVITLRLLLDLDTAATARILGLPAATVASHLRRGLAVLRREIPSFDDQELTR